MIFSPSLGPLSKSCIKLLVWSQMKHSITLTCTALGLALGETDSICTLLDSSIMACVVAVLAHPSWREISMMFPSYGLMNDGEVAQRTHCVIQTKEPACARGMLGQTGGEKKRVCIHKERRKLCEERVEGGCCLLCISSSSICTAFIIAAEKVELIICRTQFPSIH